MASTLPEQKAYFELLRESPWISKDPVLQYKLREIALRWVEARRLLLNPDLSDITSSLMSDDSGLEGTSKRFRCESDDSIVEEKGFRTNQSVPAQTGDVPALDPPQGETLEWECKKCTFMNPAEATTSCSICGCFKSRSADVSGVPGKSVGGKAELPVEKFIILHSSSDKPPVAVSKKDDIHGEILSRSLAGSREHRLTGVPISSSPAADCTVYASVYNLLVFGQAQEESAWINSVEKDVFAVHTLDEELLFSKRWLAAKKLSMVSKNAGHPEETSILSVSTTELSQSSPEDEEEALRKAEADAHKEYADKCNKILGVSFPAVNYIVVGSRSRRLSWLDWKVSGVHTEEFLTRLVTIHMELVSETHRHYEPYKSFICTQDPARLLRDEPMSRKLFHLFLNEPRCDLNLHCLSHVEGDNMMDRFLIPSSMERADLIYAGLTSIWNSSSERRTAFVAARPPGHHCPSFEDRLIGLSSTSCSDSSHLHHTRPSTQTKLEKHICTANGLQSAPREHGMGFCALNGLAVALKRFLQIHNPAFEITYKRSIRVAILDLDIHAGNGTELVFRNSKSVLHISFHRYGWLKANTPEGDFAERVMPGTHFYRDVGGVFGKHVKKPRGEGYSVNVTLRKSDGNAEVLSGFESVALPIMKEFRPDVVLVACGFDGLKLSPVFKQRWGEESCPGMDAEYTPSLYGYIVNRVRCEVQSKVLAATEGGYDPISVGLAARSVVKALKGNDIPKPPIRIFNSDWIPQLNNIFQLQQMFWASLNH